jgi:hypothetical protein
MDSDSSKTSRALASIAESCDGFSGRSLRKLAFLAHARFVQKEGCSMEQFLIALRLAVIHEKKSISCLKENK